MTTPKTKAATATIVPRPPRWELVPVKRWQHHADGTATLYRLTADGDWVVVSDRDVNILREANALGTKGQDQFFDLVLGQYVWWNRDTGPYIREIPPAPPAPSASTSSEPSVPRHAPEEKAEALLPPEEKAEALLPVPDDALTGKREEKGIPPISREELRRINAYDCKKHLIDHGTQSDILHVVRGMESDVDAYLVREDNGAYDAYGGDGPTGLVLDAPPVPRGRKIDWVWSDTPTLLVAWQSPLRSWSSRPSENEYSEWLDEHRRKVPPQPRRTIHEQNLYTKSLVQQDKDNREVVRAVFDPRRESDKEYVPSQYGSMIPLFVHEKEDYCPDPLDDEYADEMEAPDQEHDEEEKKRAVAESAKERRLQLKEIRKEEERKEKHEGSKKRKAQKDALQEAHITKLQQKVDEDDRKRKESAKELRDALSSILFENALPRETLAKIPWNLHGLPTEKLHLANSEIQKMLGEEPDVSLDVEWLTKQPGLEKVTPDQWKSLNWHQTVVQYLIYLSKLVLVHLLEPSKVLTLKDCSFQHFEEKRAYDEAVKVAAFQIVLYQQLDRALPLSALGKTSSSQESVAQCIALYNQYITGDRFRAADVSLRQCLPKRWVSIDCRHGRFDRETLLKEAIANTTREFSKLLRNPKRQSNLAHQMKTKEDAWRIYEGKELSFQQAKKHADRHHERILALYNLMTDMFRDRLSFYCDRDWDTDVVNARFIPWIVAGFLCSRVMRIDKVENEVNGPKIPKCVEDKIMSDVKDAFRTLLDPEDEDTPEPGKLTGDTVRRLCVEYMRENQPKNPRENNRWCDLPAILSDSELYKRDTEPDDPQESVSVRFRRLVTTNQIDRAVKKKHVKLGYFMSDKVFAIEYWFAAYDELCQQRNEPRVISS